MDVKKDMDRRRLLYCAVHYKNSGVDKCEVEEGIKKLVDSLYCNGKGLLEPFRNKPDQPYFTWWQEQEYGVSAFVLRLKSPYYIDHVCLALRAIEGVHDVYASWFPSRNSYGGTVQQDGSVIETWDI
jgi:hypothetical protein